MIFVGGKMKKFNLITKQIKYKNILVLLIFSIAVLTITACSNKDNKTADQTTKTDQAATEPAKETEAPTKQTDLSLDAAVLKVKDVEVTYREALIYMLQLKDKYEPSLGEDIWSFDLGEDGTFDEYAKREVIDQITQLKIVCQQAKALGITLTEDELLEINESVVSYMQGITEEDKTTYGITEEIVKQVLSDNYLMEKVFSITTNEVDTDISDEEAKQIKVWQILVMTSGEDKNEKAIDMTEEEKKEAYKRAKTLLTQVKASDDFYSFAKTNSDASEVEFTLGKGDLEANYETAAFALKKDQVSDIIETESGYYILYCVSEFDEEATALKKEAIIKERQDETFASKYKEWSANFKVTENTTLWNQISFVSLGE